MKKISMSVIFCCFLACEAFAGFSFDTSQPSRLIDIDQNQAYGSESALFLNISHSPSYRVASVNFITGNRQLEFGGIEFNDTTIDDCKREGYDKTQCLAGQTPREQCPYNPSYYKSCCDAAFKYDKDACSYPMTISSESCGGKYKCYCDKSLYPVTSCTAPQVVSSGDSCTEDGKVSYARCECPSSYSQTCTAKNQQGVGTGCSINGTTKYTSCQCKSGYTLTCSDLGPTNTDDYCLMNGIKYYNSCKTCANRCTVADADKQEGVSYEYEECSKKYCAIGCATNYVNWCTKPETDCAKLGYTKSASQCADGYLQCPYNAAAVFCED